MAPDVPVTPSVPSRAQFQVFSIQDKDRISAMQCVFQKIKTLGTSDC